MKHARIIGVLVLLVASLAVLTVPTYAACIPADGNGANNSITCNSTFQVVGSISGRGGNDTISLFTGAASSTEDVYGDNSASGTGNDSLVINSLADNIYGDVDSTGIIGVGQQTSGDDTIRIVGPSGDVDNIFGDYHFRDGFPTMNGNGDTNPRGGDDSISIESGSEVDVSVYGDYVGDSDGVASNPGGDDTISVNSTVSGDVVGDRIRGGGSANADGGNDSIRINTLGVVGDDIFGDDVEDDGGNDTIIISGSVGDDVFGDYMAQPDSCCTNDGGDDSITVAGTVGGTIYGDYEASSVSGSGSGGNDTIIVQNTGRTGPIYGDHIEGNGGADSIVIGAGGSTSGTVRGDFIIGTAGAGNGGDDYIQVQGTTGGSVYGDDARGNGGDDTILVNTGGRVRGDIRGDSVDGTGGNDSITIFGAVNGAVSRTISGDYSDGDGGNDYILLDNNGGFSFKGNVYGDNVQTDSADGGDDTIIVNDISTDIDGDIFGDGINGLNALGGKDSILINGSVTGNVRGDNDTLGAGKSRRDTITISLNARVNGAVSGDFTKKAGSKDTITIFGTVDKSVYGDQTNRAGGDDSIEVKASGLVKKNLVGDQVKTIQGGKDTITVRGTVNQNVIGDSFIASAKPDANGGDDTITVITGGLVKGDVIGDSAPADGGDDSITIHGTVNGDVIGDSVGLTGGRDTIVVTGRVMGDVIGDDAGTPFNPANTGGQDAFSITGIVDGTVYLDNVGGPTLPDVVGDGAGIDLAVGGDDIIFVAGQIGGDILSATGLDGDDIFVIQDGATVGGMMDAGAHKEGDSLIFDLSTTSKGEFNKLSELFEGLTVEDGRVRYRGNRYNWVNFELLDFFIQYFETRTVPLVCSGIYEKNAEGTACVRKGAEEYDAIMFHRNNPGYDGRMPGTEACAIYNYGNAMRVYEVVDGSEGELVTTISADVFSHNIDSNLLLASSASGNVNVYYLTSNEVQVECRDWTGKTQVRIIPDFSGTVNASFDKEQG